MGHTMNVYTSRSDVRRGHGKLVPWPSAANSSLSAAKELDRVNTFGPRGMIGNLKNIEMQHTL